jgi:erythritol kinase
VLASLDGLMAGGRPGALLYHPFIAEAGERGPFLDGNARASLIGLSQRHGLADLVRAVVEGLCLAARDCYRAIGEMPAEVRLCGGVARSPAFRQIFASVLGVPVRRVRREEAGAAGAAMIAAVSLGLYHDLESCIADWVAPMLEATQAPDPALVTRYNQQFEIYRRSCRALQPVWRDARRMT